MVSVVVEPGCCSVMAFSVERSDTSVITLRLMRPSDSTTGVNTRLTPNFLKSTLGWQTGGDLVVSQDSPLGIGKFAAGQEGRGLARDRRQIRLGQRADHAGALHRAQRGVDARRHGAGDRIGGDALLHLVLVLLSAAPLAENGLLVLKLNTPSRMKPKRAGEIDAELLDHVALHFGDRDLEHAPGRARAR